MRKSQLPLKLWTLFVPDLVWSARLSADAKVNKREDLATKEAVAEQNVLGIKIIIPEC